MMSIGFVFHKEKLCVNNVNESRLKDFCIVKKIAVIEIATPESLNN